MPTFDHFDDYHERYDASFDFPKFRNFCYFYRCWGGGGGTQKANEAPPSIYVCFDEKSTFSVENKRILIKVIVKLFFITRTEPKLLVTTPNVFWCTVTPQ